MKKLLLLLSLGIVILSAKAQIPEGYYDGTDGLGGEALKTALYNIIKGHTEYEYTSSKTDVWDILKETDRDPNNPDNVILLYSGRSVNAAQEYNNANGWTREHVWAKSHGIHDASVNPDIVPGPATDVHNLRPCDNDVNTARNSRWFAECSEEYIDDGFATGSYTSSTDWVWEPRDEVKGDVARMIFYMATRYEGENGEPDLEIVDYLPADNYSKEPIFAKLSDLLKWNVEDPVDEFEQNRNNVIDSYQHNRNPFIDHPEWVECIFNNNCSGFWFASSPTTELTERESYSYTISAAGGEATLTITGETVPSWLTFTSTLSEIGNATATLVGQPAFENIGKHTVSIKLSNGTDAIYQDFEVVVSDGNPITFTSTPVTKVMAEDIYTYPITGDGDPNAVFTLTGTTLPSWLSLDASTIPATLSGTPTMNDLGENQVVLTLSDNTQSTKVATQEFTINVYDPNAVNTVIITQYYEGVSNNKHLELTNIGNETVNLSNYYLGTWHNTDAPTGVYYHGDALTGSIAAGETQVFKNLSAVLPVDAVANAVATTTATYFNGDDPIALTRNGDTWEDRVDCLYSTGTWGLDKGFYRKASVTAPNTDMSVLDGTGEWVEITTEQADNATSNMPEYLGFHGESPNGIEDISNEFRIYPNPATNLLTVETSHKINKIEIISLAGNTILVASNLNEKSIDVSVLEKGIYFLKITNLSGNIATLKFVKQ